MTDFVYYWCKYQHFSFIWLLNTVFMTISYDGKLTKTWKLKSKNSIFKCLNVFPNNFPNLLSFSGLI